MIQFRFPYRQALASACLLAASTSSQGQALHTVDVLGIYSDHAAALVADPAALFVSNIEYANRALANSQANYRYNLVHVQRQNWANDNSLGSAQLESFQQDTTIRALREQYGADLVAGIVPTSAGLCGIGYLPISTDGQTIRSYSRSYGYSLSGHSCGGRTMAHEMGHNAGLGHSAAQGSSGTFGTWARGYGVQSSFVTIMAYNGVYGVYSSEGRLQVHANPNISICQGQPCGVTHTRSDGADAVRALNMVASQLEAYTESVVGEPINLAPVAVDDSATTDQDKAVTLNVLGNDSDPENQALTLVSVSEPAHGTASIQVTTRSVRYEPDTGYWGTDSFSYTISDAAGATATATVTITVNEVIDVDPPGLLNLVVNGDAEAGLEGWNGVWGTTVSVASPGLDGNRSIRATGGYAITADLTTPIAGGRNMSLSATLRSNAGNRAFAYLRILQNGRWRYKYVTGANLLPGQPVQLQRIFALPSGEVTAGYVMFYFPYRVAGEVLVDLVSLSVE